MRRCSRGFMMIDATAALLLTSATMGALFWGVTQYRRATQRLADDQRATQVAEWVLTALAAKEPLPETIDGIPFRIETTTEDGRQWTRVAVTINGRTRSLRGLLVEGTR